MILPVSVLSDAGRGRPAGMRRCPCLSSGLGAMWALVVATLCSLATAHNSGIVFPLEAPARVLQVLPDVHLAVDAVFGVAERLTDLLPPSRNLLLSPLSIAGAVGQLLLGAEGDTRQTLERLLSISETDAASLKLHRQLGRLLRHLQSGLEHGELHVACALFLQRGLRLRAAFGHALADLYGSEVTTLDFREDPSGSLLAVNQWAAKHTRGLIPVVLHQPLPSNAGSLFANAIYFRGTWQAPFDANLTIPGRFSLNSTHRVSIELMRGAFDTLYAESTRLACSMVALPYQGSEVTLYVILPADRNSDIRNFSSSLSSSDVRELIDAAEIHNVIVSLPKMQLSRSFSLREPLKRYWESLHRDSGHEGNIVTRVDDPDDSNKHEKNNTGGEDKVRPAQGSSNKTEQLGNSSNGTEIRKDTPGCRKNITGWGTGAPKANSTVENGYVQTSSDMKNGTNETRRIIEQSEGCKAPDDNPVGNRRKEDRNRNTTQMVSVVIRNSSISDKESGSFETEHRRNGTFNTTHKPLYAQRENVSNEQRFFYQPSTVMGKAPSLVHWENQRRHHRSAASNDHFELQLGGVSEDPRFRVVDILHQATLQVTEMGSEAAAVTSTIVDYMLSGKVLKVTRPFLMLIRHEGTKAVLFWGAIGDPTGGTGRVEHVLIH